MLDAIYTFFAGQPLPVAILGLFVVYLISQLRAKDEQITELQGVAERSVIALSENNETSRQLSEHVKNVAERQERLEQAQVLAERNQGEMLRAINRLPCG